MIFLPRLYLVVGVLSTRFVVHVKMDEVERFVVVSNSPDVENFYAKVRSESKRTGLLNEFEIKANNSMRKRICDGITDSHVFRRDLLYPYQKFGTRFVDFVSRFNYSYKNIRIKLSPESTSLCRKDGETNDIFELAFVCLVVKGWRKKYFFISDAYDLNFESNSLHYPGRFVFDQTRRRDSFFKVYALAELPAVAFYSPDYDVENLYLQRRGKMIGFTGVSRKVWNAKGDPLCKLNDQEKERICLAVFTSKYFVERVSYSPLTDFSTFCQVRNVSFQTELGVAAALKFEEWLLSCYSNADLHGFAYLLSQAYLPDQVLVHLIDKYSGDAFPDHVVTNVRLTWSPPNPIHLYDSDSTSE